MISGIVLIMAAISGAAVIFLIVGGLMIFPSGERVGFRYWVPYISSRSEKPLVAGMMFSILWMPFLVGERNGPSQ